MKKIICLILSFVLCTLCCTTAFCTTNVPTPCYDIDVFREYITDIYEKNYDELVSIAKTLDNIDVSDEYITYDSNCGPCSVAFQNILYKNDILVEVVERTLSRTHAFNLYRASLDDNCGKICPIVVDTTYKQFIVDEYISQGLTVDDLAEDVPPVLVYKYGDYNELVRELENIKNSLPENMFESVCKEVFDNHYKYEYIPQDFQDVPHKEMTTYDSKLLDDLRNNSGKTNVKLNGAAILSSTTTDYKSTFHFDCNGVYRRLVPFEDISEISNGFVIADINGNTIFGCDIENETLAIANTSTYVNHDNDLKILSSQGTYPLSINTQNLYSQILVSIDLRAGENKAAIYIHPVSTTAKYGDINNDSNITVEDVTYLQKTIAKHEGYALDVYKNETANVTKTKPHSILNATQISRYLAKYETEKCGETLYFSSAFRVGHIEGLGYIDM